MSILIGCEESQALTIELRKRGLKAFSCDLQECSGGYPEYHIQGDVIKEAYSGKYLAMIAFPPCTYLSSVQTFLCRKDPERVLKRIAAADFFMKLMNAPIEVIALENPSGVMKHIYRDPDQTIHPYFFGDTVMKRTCLWLKNLPKLIHVKEDNLFSYSTYGQVPEPSKTWIQKSTGKRKNIRQVNKPFLSGKERSKLSPILAEAMAEQWTPILNKLYLNKEVA